MNNKSAYSSKNTPHLKELKIAEMPKPPKSVFKLLGPSFILIGLGLGTGELVLWPYLVANWGLGIIWGAVLGITMQFFLNMEIERYALANGESAFVGFARMFKNIPYWFIASTALAWSWPGFSASAAYLLTPFGVTNPTAVAIEMLILVGLILTLGPVLYKTVESFQKVLILIGIPLILIIVISLIKFSDLIVLSEGIFGIGHGYFFFPHSLPLMSFLAAFAYAGAGGNTNLAQSFYIKEKGYGMGKYAGKITSLITGKSEKIDIEGTTFKPTKENLARFRAWWRLINLEHAIVFWGLGLFTILMLAVLAYSTVYGESGNNEGLQFLINQYQVIYNKVGSIIAGLLLIVSSLMLFATQLAVVDASSRIISENIALAFRKKVKPASIPKIYYASVWTLLTFGITVLLLGLDEPQALITIGAVLNAFCMFVFSGILIKLNKTLLPKEIHPSDGRVLIIYITFIFFGIFSFLVLKTSILDYIAKF